MRPALLALALALTACDGGRAQPTGPTGPTTPRADAGVRTDGPTKTPPPPRTTPKHSPATTPPPTPAPTAAPPPTPTRGPGNPDAATPTAPLCRFAASGRDWSLPGEFPGQLGNLSDLASCAAAPDVLHTTIDLTGDGLPDMVVLNGCAVDASVGRTHWRVFVNTGAGFSATGMDWPLPSEFVGQLGNLSDVASCAAAPDVLHTTLDLDGDGRLDMVVLNGCAVEPTIGQTRWRWFRNTGSGFAATGADWALPTEFPGQLGNLSDVASCAAAPDILHTTLDLDGDAKVDMVVLNGCAVQPTIGQTRWRYFRNTGTGFAATGTDWALPTEFPGQLGNLSDLSSCAAAPDVLHTTLDLDGDAKVDMVVLNGCAVDASIGQTRWRLFRNTGTGFAASGADWALPAEFPGQLGTLSDLASCAAAPDILHTTFDLTGDGKLDMVVLNGCAVDASIGQTRWRVFANEGTRFSPGGADWALPTEFPGQLGNLSDLASCAAAPDILHTTMSLATPRGIDMVVLNGCAVEPSIGQTRWRVFAAERCR
jgi:hypothetical protein